MFKKNVQTLLFVAITFLLAGCGTTQGYSRNYYSDNSDHDLGGPVFINKFWGALKTADDWVQQNLW